MPEYNESIILRGAGVSLHYGSKTILNEVSFAFKPGEVVGIVGKNGSGKSSFLKLIAGTQEPDSGKLEFKNGVSKQYVTQEFELDTRLTVFETIAKSMILSMKVKASEELIYLVDILDSKEPWMNLDVSKHEVIYNQVLDIIRNLNCPELGIKISNLSGGEKRKVSIAAALLTEPDILILDEPTNHLDIKSIERLEKTLKSYKGCVILVSHDRYFLDNLATRMIEIFDGNLYEHAGSYQDYLLSKSVRIEISTTEESKRESFLKRELNWVRAGVKARGTKDKGRMLRFNETKDLRNGLKDESVELLLPNISPLGNKIINIENAEIKIGDKIIVKNLNFDFQAGTCLGIVGDNGSGKTTLVKAILHQHPISAGKIVIGQNTVFNYQDQEKWDLNLEATPFEEIGESQETMEFGEGTTKTRSYLKRLLFDSQRIMTPIKLFSGGEKARLLLAKLLKRSGNCLVLDEPTNDLDLDTIRILEESILQYRGVSIVVSHDRYFLNRVCNVILYLKGNGEYILSTGNYDDLLSKNRLGQIVETPKIEDPYKISSKILRETEKELKSIERVMTKLESRVQALKQELLEPDYYVKDPEKYLKQAALLEALQPELDEMINKWLGLSDKLVAK